MTSPILVTGGTGTLGRLVVPRLRGAGCEVRVLSRRQHDGSDGIEFVTGDLATGEGIEAAAEGTEIIVHCAGSRKGDEDKTRHLVRAASRAGARHLVFISVVGADRVPLASAIDRAMFGYFGSKLAAERAVADSGLPWTTLRATQFHDLTLMTVRQTSLSTSNTRLQATRRTAKTAEVEVKSPASLHGPHQTNSWHPRPRQRTRSL